jgi:hypothetical protein
MRTRAFVGVALVSMVSGCAHGEEPMALTSTSGALARGAASVCVVRPGGAAHDVSMPVRDNGHLVGATRGATFFCYLASAGDHQITSVDDDTGPTLLRARAGASYWLHQDVSELGGAVHAHLDWVEETTAAEMVEACEARVRVAVPGHDDEPGAMPIAPAKAR